MKKVILILAIAAAAFSCKKDDDTPVPHTVIEHELVNNSSREMDVEVTADFEGYGIETTKSFEVDPYDDYTLIFYRTQEQILVSEINAEPIEVTVDYNYYYYTKNVPASKTFYVYGDEDYFSSTMLDSYGI